MKGLEGGVLEFRNWLENQQNFQFIKVDPSEFINIETRNYPRTDLFDYLKSLDDQKHTSIFYFILSSEVNFDWSEKKYEMDKELIIPDYNQGYQLSKKQAGLFYHMIYRMHYRVDSTYFANPKNEQEAKLKDFILRIGDNADYASVSKYL